MKKSPSTPFEAFFVTIVMAVIGAFLGAMLAIPGAGAVVFAIATMGAYLIAAINRNN